MKHRVLKCEPGTSYGGIR